MVCVCNGIFVAVETLRNVRQLFSNSIEDRQVVEDGAQRWLFGHRARTTSARAMGSSPSR